MLNFFLEKTSSVAFERSEVSNVVVTCETGCEKEDTTMNNDKRLILFEQTLREREREGGREGERERKVCEKAMSPFSHSANYGSVRATL